MKTQISDAYAQVIGRQSALTPDPNSAAVDAIAKSIITTLNAAGLVVVRAEDVSEMMNVALNAGDFPRAAQFRAALADQSGAKDADV